MSEPNLPQFHKRQQETVVNIAENLFLDKQTLFNKLQYPLSNIECQKRVLQQICSQLVSEGIFDAVVVNKYISTDGDGDFRQLVWEFRNEEYETILRFLEILKNLHDFPVLCKKFRKVINKVVSENYVVKETNPSRFVESGGNQVSSTGDTALINQSDTVQENEKFIYSEEATTNKSIVYSGRKNLCTTKQNVILAAFITAVVILLVALLIYMSIRPKYMAISDDTSSTLRTPFNFTEDQLPEYTTIDPRTVETKFNESMYSYNFL